MSVLNYECSPNINEIEIVEDILEVFLKHNKLDSYRQFCFAAHELLINSVEAMSKQTNKNDKLYIKITEDINFITFSVTDTGGGLPKGVINNLTEYDASTMEAHGRGLFMIHSLVDDFILSEDGKGNHTYKIIKSRLVTIESEGIKNDKH